MSSGGNNAASLGASSYLQKMQRGNLIQSFGCMIVVTEHTFSVLAYSENAPMMLGFPLHVLAIGVDACTLFCSSDITELRKTTRIEGGNLYHPILVHGRHSGKPFYAIMHRIDVGLVIDLEPINPADAPVTVSSTLESYKLAANAISRLQTLPCGNISSLCDVLVSEVSEMTGYDRVMAYMFHEDEHGEVLAERLKSDLEPYLGSHYPATDIPQASRFLFMKNKVRMICDCSSQPIKVIKDKTLTKSLNLGGSVLRAPHGCHVQYMKNMGSVASLALAVTINEDDDEIEVDQQSRRLWGLVICHHTSSRFTPFPLRNACEILMQVFSMQLNKEVRLAALLKEKHTLRTQTVLRGMLVRDAPVGIVSQSPNAKDLIKCDGVALYYRNKTWLLGITPTEAQLRDIVEWLLRSHNGSTSLCTDSLMEAGYPGASVLSGAVCGMVAINITYGNFLFWFRSHTAKEVKWAGAKHNSADKDDIRRMHPRSSFKAFMEVVKWRSLPWEDIEMAAIHSLQLILRKSLQDKAINNVKTSANERTIEVSNQGMVELHSNKNKMLRLIETASVLIAVSDASGTVNGWNPKAAELTGLGAKQAIGMPLTDLVEDDSVEVVNNMLKLALQGTEEKNVEIRLRTFGSRERNGSVIIVVSTWCRQDTKGTLTGISFVGQDVTEQKIAISKYTRIQGDYTAIVQSPSALIPPVFMSDKSGRCFEWNDGMQKLSGWKREEAINKMLLGEVFTLNSFGCKVKDQDTLTKLSILLNGVIAGANESKMLFGFFERQGKYVEALLIANKRVDAEGQITGVLGFLHVASPELQHALQAWRISENAAMNSLMELAYVRQEIRLPLQGILYTCYLMRASKLNIEQEQLVRRSILCQEQLIKILDDIDLESIEQCYLEMNNAEFNLGEVLEVVLIQGTPLSKEQQLMLVCDLPKDVCSMVLYGDSARLQQVLSDFLINAILFSPTSKESLVVFKLNSTKEHIGRGLEIVHLEFRISHPPPGIPEPLIQEMFNLRDGVTSEGLGLYICEKLVKIMNGTVEYLREAHRSSFIVRVEFPLFP